MRITILLLLATILISGCATEGQFNASRKFDISPATLAALSSECDNSGGTSARLDYGFTGSTQGAKTRIKIKGLVHVIPGEIFAIELKPKSNGNISTVDIDAAMVTISGKECAPGEIPPESDCFLSAGPASYNNTAPGHELIICVPADQPSGPYYYNVEIKDVGKLDPRADVC